MNKVLKDELELGDLNTRMQNIDVSGISLINGIGLDEPDDRSMNNNYKGENIGNSYYNNDLQSQNSPYKPPTIKQDNNYNQVYSHQHTNSNSSNNGNGKQKPSFKLAINDYNQSNNSRNNSINNRNDHIHNYSGQYETANQNTTTVNMHNSHSHSNVNGLSQILKSSSSGYNKSSSMNDGRVIADKNYKTLKSNTISASPISPHK